MTLVSDSKIAIIGSSLSGLLAAYALSKTHTVSLFESKATLGQNCLQQSLSQSDQGSPFILSRDTDPHLSYVFSQLGIATAPVRQVFPGWIQTFFTGCDLPLGHFSAPTCTFSKAAFDRYKDILRFVFHMKRRPKTSPLSEPSVAEYLQTHGYSDMFIQACVVPLGLCILAATPAEILEMPMAHFHDALQTHGLFRIRSRPAYRKLMNEAALCTTIRARWRVTCHVNTPILRIHRDLTGVSLDAGIEKKRFDKVIIATSADTALALLETPSDAEKEALAVWQYGTQRYPILTAAALAHQPALSHLNGQQHSFFCGSYFGLGRPEDAVRATLAVLHHFGTRL
jgi:hypothetical protein